MINLSFNIHSIGYLPILSLATAIGIFIISLSFLIGVCIVAVSFIVLIIYTASEYLSLPIFERFLSDMLIRSILRVRILTYEAVISNYLQPLEMEESPQSIEERNKLRQQAIEKLLPLMVYGGGGNHPLKSRECAICLEDYVGGESCRAFPECKHTFHLSCIDRWLENHLTCPVCRKSI